LRTEEDHAHILEKMRQWRHLTMRSQVGGDEERAVILDDIISRKLDENHELADITFLCQGLHGPTNFDAASSSIGKKVPIFRKHKRRT